MFDFEAISRAMSGQTVLCVGDLMLDEFVYGEVSRISPEAPAPVIAVRRSETNIGGAGNVARNIASLGGRCIFVGLIGEEQQELRHRFRQALRTLKTSSLYRGRSEKWRNELPWYLLLGPEGSGFRTAMAVLDNGRIEVAAMAVGIARAALAAAGVK